MNRKITFILAFLIGLCACEDQEIRFKDYDVQAVYFPIQLPLRTLSLGEDRVDNSLDREYKFDIGVSIGGMYENYKDWTVDFIVDPSLTDSVYTNSNPPFKIRPLPTAYYTLTPENTVTIPKGSFNGRIRVELNEEFFQDPLAILGHYVIPLRITSTSADSILTGKSVMPEGQVPDKRINAHWDPTMRPKDWVMFGIKYVNAYHGWYLHRGKDIVVETATGIPVDTIVFMEKYNERDLLIKLNTIDKYQVVANGLGNKTNPEYSMILEFENDKGASGNVIVKANPDSPYKVSGSGQYFEKADRKEEWSMLIWQSMYLNYTYEEGPYTHNISDTLVFRDRDLKFEEISIQVRTQ